MHQTISIHAPARGATALDSLRNRKIKFQSTLPRGERRGGASDTYDVMAISIHAPARGATRNEFEARINAVFQSTLPRGERHSPTHVNPPRQYISIHAPARGATRLCRIFFLRSRNFNPRSREGSDACVFVQHWVVNISIHAPARGATVNGYCSSTNTTISIHAPARGATVSYGVLNNICANFNPRSREGSDLPSSLLQRR